MIVNETVRFVSLKLYLHAFKNRWNSYIFIFCLQIRKVSSRTNTDKLRAENRSLVVSNFINILDISHTLS